jgi:hypothetical protein
MSYARTLAGIFSLLFLFVSAGSSQDSKKETQLRTVRGVVTDKSDNPLPNSVVFLKNLRTNSVRSNFADSEGNYRFSGLDPNADYEVHAEFEGAKSPARNVSYLDSRREMVINLKIERKKN